MASVIFPWPSREERRARITAARVQAEHAEEKAERARRLKAELHDLREKNHVKEALDMLIRRPGEQR